MVPALAYPHAIAYQVRDRDRATSMAVHPRAGEGLGRAALQAGRTADRADRRRHQDHRHRRLRGRPSRQAAAAQQHPPHLGSPTNGLGVASENDTTLVLTAGKAVTKARPRRSSTSPTDAAYPTHERKKR